MKYCKTTLVGASLFASCFANATITILAGPGNVFGDENVLFNQAGLLSTGTTVQGSTNQTHFIVDFASTTSLGTPSGGQARITSETPGGTYQDLCIYLDDPTASFTSLILNVNAATSGNINFTVDQLVGGPVVGTFDLSKNGENFFQIIASDGERMTDVSFITDGTVSDVRQVRVGGAAVPEPASLALIGAGIVALIRRKRGNSRLV